MHDIPGDDLGPAPPSKDLDHLLDHNLFLQNLLLVDQVFTEFYALPTLRTSKAHAKKGLLQGNGVYQGLEG